jgi:hypothetical protein
MHGCTGKSFERNAEVQVGLDVYVGSLTRYYLQDWQTVVQQAGTAAGMQVQVVRTEPVADDQVTDPEEVLGAVAAWCEGLGQALGVACEWPESADSPYWTDKPDWDGYGAVMLAAAYDERPDLRPTGAGLFRRKASSDPPRDFGEARAYQAASANPTRYPSLLGGAEWWLPIGPASGSWAAPRLSGEVTRMSTVGSLGSELVELAQRTGLLNGMDREDILQRGVSSSDAPLEEVAPFGLALLLGLAERALLHRQPLLLDY